MSGRMPDVLPVSLGKRQTWKNKACQCHQNYGGKLKQLEVIEARDVRFAPAFLLFWVEIVGTSSVPSATDKDLMKCFLEDVAI